MSYSTSTFSRVDKAWPAMSDSTQARIQRLRELEQKRLEKQAALLAQRNSEPIPMPKFESRITSFRTTFSKNDQDKHDTSVTEKNDVEKMEEKGNGTDKEGTTSKGNQESVSQTTYLLFSSGEEKTENTDNKEKVLESMTVDKRVSADVTKAISEPPRTVSTSYVSGPLSPTSTEKTRISVVRKMKLDSLPSVKITPREQTSESVISGASVVESPQISAEVTKVTETKESPSQISTEVTEVIETPESPPQISTEVTEVIETKESPPQISAEVAHVIETVLDDSNTTINEKDENIVEVVECDFPEVSDKKTVIPETKSYLTLQEFKVISGMDKSAVSEKADVELKMDGSVDNKDAQTDKGTVDITGSVRTDISDETEENAGEETTFTNVEVGPTVLSPLKEHVKKESSMQISEDFREDSSKLHTDVSSSSLQSSDAETVTGNDSLIQTDKVSDSKQSTSDTKTALNTISVNSDSKPSTSDTKEVSATLSDTKTSTTGSTNNTLEQLSTNTETTPSQVDVTATPVQSSDDAKETVFRLGTLAVKQTLEVAAKIDEKFSSVSDNVQVGMTKLEELEKQRKDRKKALEEEGKEDLSQLPVRERFFRTQSVGRITRPVRQQSLPEQIRASRLSRRTSDYSQTARTGSPGKAAEAESPPTARRSRLQQRSADRLRRRTIDSVPVLAKTTSREVTEERPKPKPVLDIDSLDKAFGRPDQERLSRLDELDRIRAQNRELAKRRDSAPQLAGADSIGNISTRLDFPSSLIVNRGSSENISQFPIHEHLESSFPSSRFSSTATDSISSRTRELLRSISTDRPLQSVQPLSRPILRPSYSESRLFPLDGGRLSQSGVLSVSTDMEHLQLQQSSNQQQTAVDSESDETPVYMEGSPQGTPVIDNEGRTHWVGPTSPRLSTYLSVIDRLENRNRSSSFDSNFGNVPTYRHRAINSSESLLDVSNQDHYLAECFLKKYTLKERCALIREKIYGKSKDSKTGERGKPDGASHDIDSSKNKTDDVSHSQK